MTATNKLKPVEIHIGKSGGVRLADADAFFKRPKVIERQETLRSLNIAGKTIVGNKLIPTAELEKKENGS